MSNVANTIDRHNKAILNKRNDNTQECNCINKRECPLSGKCLTSSLIYQATVETNNGAKIETYIGLTENKFKLRYYNHKASFNHREKENSTELSKYIWKLKDQNISYNIKWKIITKAKAFNRATKQCRLCLAEKFYIIFQPELSSLNERRELVTTCRHANKHLLCSNQQLN